MSDKIQLVKNAMLAVQRYPWEQGVCAQAVWELGEVATTVAMAHDAVLRQKEDGRRPGRVRTEGFSYCPPPLRNARRGGKISQICDL